MRKFTVKDFIGYNNPCFSCDNQINFKIGFLDLDVESSSKTSYSIPHAGPYIPSCPISYLRPTVTPQFTEIDLMITYSDALKLYIFHKTNKILTSSQRGLTKYLESHKLFL